MARRKTRKSSINETKAKKRSNIRKKKEEPYKGEVGLNEKR
ncbi:MAG TPA: hypothetical protein VEF35_00055 [Candidatus Bathyarchaeia archaeon]|nr:hypothetical protein [Candidatus Bathyarchaeia archaeon]